MSGARPILDPLASVIVRTKDRPRLLREALASVAAQTHRPVELVVVNDGGCPVDDVVEEAHRKVPCRLVLHERPRGRAAAANAGIAASAGEWVAFLDDDDLYLANHLEVTLAAARREEAVLAYAACRLQREDGSGDETFAVPFDRELLQLANFIPTCSVAVSRSAVLEVGGFDESLPYLEDWDLWLRLAAGRRFAFAPEVTSVYRVRPGSVGGDMAAERWEAMERVLSKHWDGLQARQVVSRLHRLEADAQAWRRRALEAEGEVARQREQGRFVRELADSGLLGFAQWLVRRARTVERLLHPGRRPPEGRR